MFLGHAGSNGHTLIDRRVYVPASWTDDRQQCAAAGVPDEIGFATKSQRAADMITADLDPVLGWSIVRRERYCVGGQDRSGVMAAAGGAPAYPPKTPARHRFSVTIGD